MSRPSAPARFMFEPSGTHTQQPPAPMPVGCTDSDFWMLPASSPGVSPVGKLPPLLLQRFELVRFQLLRMLVSTCMPRPLLPTDRRFRAVMLQPFGFALHGAPSVRSWSPMTPASTFVPKTDTFSTTVSFTPRAKTPTFCVFT